MPERSSELRVGVVLSDAERQPRWRWAALVELLRSPALASLELLSLRPTDPPLPRGVALYEWLDRRVYGRLYPGHLLEEIPRPLDLRLAAGSGRDLDLVLWLAPGPPAPAARRGARLGALWITAGDDPRLLLVDALREDRREVALQLRLASAGRDAILLESPSGLDRHSLFLSRNPLLAKAALLPRRGVERLAAGTTTAPGAIAPAAAPRNRSLVQLGARLGLRLWQARWARRRRREEWSVGVLPTQGGTALRAQGPGFRAHDPPPGEWFADPMLVDHAGATWLFVERCPAEGKGAIAAARLDAVGGVERWETVLEEPFHLSYPFVFVHAGETWLVPETRAAGEVRLYRAHDFPRDWRLERVLVPGVEAVDATLTQHEGRWWLLAAVVGARYASSRDELSAWFADDLHGSWTPHPLNPLVSSIRCARPAGPLFRHEGQLIRPAQDSSRSYGGAVKLMAVERLDPEGYAERELYHLAPTWREGLLGSHTWSVSPRFVATDGLRVIPRG